MGLGFFSFLCITVIHSCIKNENLSKNRTIYLCTYAEWVYCIVHDRVTMYLLCFVLTKIGTFRLFLHVWTWVQVWITFPILVQKNKWKWKYAGSGPFTLTLGSLTSSQKNQSQLTPTNPSHSNFKKILFKKNNVFHYNVEIFGFIWCHLQFQLSQVTLQPKSSRVLFRQLSDSWVVYT